MNSEIADKKYYVYAHKTPDGNVFYVGKGMGERQHKFANRNLFWKRIAAKYGHESFIIEDNLGEEEAYAREIYWIKYYKDIGQCRANFTIGGDGVRVEVRWWNHLISKALKGRKVPFGKDNPSYKDIIDKDKLYDLYITQKLGSIEIGHITGLSYTTITGRLKEYNIKARRPGKVSVQIKCLTDGKIFKSMNDAARYYKLFRENIRKVLHGKYKHTGGRTFEYV